MTRIIFCRDAHGLLASVELTGHAGYAEEGEDIVCAAISSAIQLTHILLSDVMGLPLETTVEQESTYIKVVLLPEAQHAGQQALGALQRHYQELQSEYSDFIKVTEVQTYAED